MSVDDYFDKRGRFIPAILADEILGETAEHYLVTPITDKGGDLTWVYHDDLGIFKPDGIAYIESQVKQRLKTRCKRGHVGEVVKLVQIGSYTEKENFEEDPTVMVLENGVLDERKLTTHNSIYNARSRLPVKYDPNAECPAILKFLSEVIPGDVDLVQEWIGYHLIKDYRFALALMLIGDGRNGKSVLLNLIRAFLGKENISEIDLYRLVANRFARAELYGKLANIAADVGSDELKRTGLFKALTGNDWITAEKKHQQPFSFRNHAKLNFSTNKLPLTPDMSRAFFRRWLLVQCSNVFTKETADPQILEKLTTPGELSGLLNWALDGRQRLIEQGRFTKSQTAEEIQILYEEMSDPVTAFIKYCVDQENEDVVSKDLMYAAYHGFCRMKGYSPLLKNVLTGELKPRIPNMGEGRRKISGRRKMCWTGISLKCQGCQGCQGFPYYVSESGGVLEQRLFTPATPDSPDTSGNTCEKKLEAEAGLEEDASEAFERRSLIVEEAVGILRELGGEAMQKTLFDKLAYNGYAWEEASPILRDNSGFRFMGMFVSLRESETGAVPQ